MLIRKVVGRRYELIADGRTVWVNSGISGMSIGRYRNGGIIDIHKAEASDWSCLFCKPWEGPDDWILFQHKMKELHGVDIPDNMRPVR